MNQTQFRNKTINYTEREGFWQSLDSWEPKSFDILDRFIQPGETFIDIGAWNGVLSVYAGLMGANVYSIEPDVLAYKELLNTMLANSGAHIIPMMAAIADITGMRWLNSRTLDGFGNSESSLIRRDEVAIDNKVFTFTLEDFFSLFKISRPCLIKIDVEGGEVLIIKKSAGFLSFHKPTLFISFHPAWFPHFKKNVEMFIDILFPIYNFYPATNLDKIVSEKEFRSMLETEHEHSFVLISKINS